ncbi:citrate/tricarballylate utilization protein [Rhodopseudomonas thermotolerans]|uniref:Citrate/tricarballylate utilization protein n=2 Tax=Rhodopseudomonas TaxID=1073 RepID=A0A336JS84_9BRAD|nr:MULTISPECIES: tricarballylate utilization 4Fe-4S protein TcuB [Rhodopseudomonas]RED34467.1 citrate/tricarballylate utilization protein [Rhodopseudomonas pentothenatexigens]REG02663.1 citrate/tricarballylate utilization protein [Rhodopseudomonas thermotolerans]SSW91136.1 citrate/tricarballylate utilization protein [Rhodopseudomonas pentothenatexigens]
MSAADPMSEAERVLRICSACMYCDGLCPVFPAIDGKHGFSLSDVSYLSNLCHNCQGCWHDCQYAPPHPFAVNLPATLAGLRQRSYADHLWPPVLGRAFRASSLAVPATVALALLITFALVLSTGSTAMLFAADAREGAFYRVLPWPAMAGLAGATFGWAVIAITLATLRYWRTVAPGVTISEILRALPVALSDIVTLRHLGGGGPGCHDDSERPSHRRRIMHHLTAGGFVLSGLSTMVAAAYHHLLGVAAPYPVGSLPVMLGLVGGATMTVGAVGLLGLEARADREPSDRGETRLNVAFLILLALVGASGLAVLGFRSTPAMGLLLTTHLGLVFGLFAALPFSKALHAPFRAAALLRAAIDGDRRASARKPDAAGDAR